MAVAVVAAEERSGRPEAKCCREVGHQFAGHYGIGRSRGASERAGQRSTAGPPVLIRNFADSRFSHQPELFCTRSPEAD